MNKSVVKIRPSGYSVSQGGTYGTVGYDPLNYKVSAPSSVNIIGGMSSNLKGGGLGAEIIGSMAGVAGGLAGAWLSGANPYIVAGTSTAVGGVAKSIAEMIGLGVIPQKYIDFVDKLISNKKTFSQIKSSIMNFNLTPELKNKLSKAVSSLLRNMTGNGMSSTGLRPKSRTALKKAMRGSGGVFQPNVSAFGLAKF